MVAPATGLALSGQLTIQNNQLTMRFLILAALVAVAAAQTVHYHDDTFHFSTLGSSSGLKRTSFQSAQPIVTKKTFQTGPLISSFAPQTTFLTAQQPILTKKTITKTFQSAPLISTIATPPVEQRFIVQQQPAFEQRFTVQQQQPAFERKVIVNEIAQPAFEQRFAVQQVAQPAFEQRYTVQQVAQPAVRQLQTYAPEYQGAKWRILSQRQEIDPSGPYKWSYATENGIQAEEEGTLINSADGPVIAAQGAFSFAGDDGKTYSVTYVADENGFRASGDHLPTPPPIPAEILRSLEENAASGEKYDDEGRLLQK